MSTSNKFPRSFLEKCELYPLLKAYKKGHTEKANTNPFYGAYPEYPDPLLRDLRIKYSNHLNIKEDLSITEDNILFTAGCTEGIDLLIRAFCEPSKESITVFYPSIPLFADIAQKNNVKVHHVNLEGNNFSEIPDDIPPSKIYFLCRPNNPVGSLISTSCLENFLLKAPGIVVVDETYIEFSLKPSISKLLKSYNNLIILRSFSKGWGLAGLRIGAVIGSQFYIDVLRKLQLPFSVNAIAQTAVSRTIDDYQNLRESLKKISFERDFLINSLKKVKFSKRIYPSEANFILCEFYEYKKIYAFLLKNDFYVCDFSHQVSNGCRISIYSPEENYRLVENLSNF